MQQCFAQISDPHLSSLEVARPADLMNKRLLGYLSWRRKRRFQHRIEILDALRADLESFDRDQLLVTGDLTHIGLPLEFQQALAWLKLLGEPDQVALVPGNHDACVKDDWSQTFALWQQYWASDKAGSDFPSLRVRGGIAFIGLSSACPTPPLMASGSLGAEQLEKLPALLQQTAARGLFRVVYLHHCPLPGKEKWRKRLTDARDLESVLKTHGAELVLHGHGHKAQLNKLPTEQGEIAVVAVPSASAAGLEGTEVAAYNRYRLESRGEDWRLRIEVQQYSLPEKSFMPAAVHELHIVRPPGSPTQSSA
jgi:3',5'-cyclic AMP phosphodiesterase CpdA